MKLPIHHNGLFELDRETFNMLIDYQLEWNKFIFDNSTRDSISLLLLDPLAGQDVLCNQLESMIDLDPCPIKCFFLRNDFFKIKELGMKVVEYNTVSVAFLAASQVISKELGGEKCTGLDNIISFLSEACKLHAEYYEIPIGVCVLMLVTEKDITNGNCEQDLLVQHMTFVGIKVIKSSFGKELQIKTGSDGHLYVGDQLINLVYLRTGYTPFAPEELEQRREIESSKAVKVNPINTQLIGMKLVQANLSENVSVVKPAKFDKFGVKICQLSKYTGPLENMILKNNNEGGNGSCVYDEIPSFVKKLTDKEKRGWIVMERLHPIVHNEKLVSEIGIGGGILSLNGKILRNEYIGYLVRTKDQMEKGGGVTAGFSKINSLKIT